MRAADYLIDIGPGAGVHGGRGGGGGHAGRRSWPNPKSLTGQYLSGKKRIEVPAARRPGNGKFLTVRGARENNLKNIDVSVPLGTFTCVTGVSGSGKSSLVNEILYKKLRRRAEPHEDAPRQARSRIEGLEHLDKVVGIDQSPIGRTPRSNPATYTGLFNDIRNLFAATQEAKARGYGPGRFSFNITRRPVRGLLRRRPSEDRDALPARTSTSPARSATASATTARRWRCSYKGKSIADVLDMTVEEALDFFAPVPRIADKLRDALRRGAGLCEAGPVVHARSPAARRSA